MSPDRGGRRTSLKLRSVTTNEGETDPVDVLRRAIAEALPRLQAVESDAAGSAPHTDTADAVTDVVNAVLLNFTKAAAPFGNQLAGMAVQQPGGRWPPR
nr:hypothetical protein [Kibdelosporangium sp. MJ126-NF4]